MALTCGRSPRRAYHSRRDRNAKRPRYRSHQQAYGRLSRIASGLSAALREHWEQSAEAYLASHQPPRKRSLRVRMSDVQGKSVTVRVDPGVRRVLKTKII